MAFKFARAEEQKSKPRFLQITKLSRLWPWCRKSGRVPSRPCMAHVCPRLGQKSLSKTRDMQPAVSGLNR